VADWTCGAHSVFPELNGLSPGELSVQRSIVVKVAIPFHILEGPLLYLSTDSQDPFGLHDILWVFKGKV
jgi:hypothetical protein